MPQTVLLKVFPYSFIFYWLFAFPFICFEKSQLVAVPRGHAGTTLMNHNGKRPQFIYGKCFIFWLFTFFQWNKMSKMLMFCSYCLLFRGCQGSLFDYTHTRFGEHIFYTQKCVSRQNNRHRGLLNKNRIFLSSFRHMNKAFLGVRLSRCLTQNSILERVE